MGALLVDITCKWLGPMNAKWLGPMNAKSNIRHCCWLPSAPGNPFRLHILYENQGHLHQPAHPSATFAFQSAHLNLGPPISLYAIPDLRPLKVLPICESATQHIASAASRLVECQGAYVDLIWCIAFLIIICAAPAPQRK